MEKDPARNQNSQDIYFMQFNKENPSSLDETSISRRARLLSAPCGLYPENSQPLHKHHHFMLVQTETISMLCCHCWPCCYDLDLKSFSFRLHLSTSTGPQGCVPPASRIVNCLLSCNGPEKQAGTSRDSWHSASEAPPIIEIQLVFDNMLVLLSFGWTQTFRNYLQLLMKIDH